MSRATVEGMDTVATMENELYRAFVGTCAGFRSDDFEVWISGMVSMYRETHGDRPSQEDLIGWVCQ